MPQNSCWLERSKLCCNNLLQRNQNRKVLIVLKIKNFSARSCRFCWKLLRRALRKNFHGLVTIFLYLIIEILKIFRFFAANEAGLNKFARDMQKSRKKPRPFLIWAFLLRRSMFSINTVLGFIVIKFSETFLLSKHSNPARAAQFALQYV